MNKIKLLLCSCIVASTLCKAQINCENLLGVWEETHRDYIYYKNNMAYEYTKTESEAFKGSKLYLTKDTLFAYVTYLLDNTVYPVSYQTNSIVIDSLDSEGNLVSTLRKHGKKVTEATVKRPYFNGDKTSYDKYSFYMFDNNHIGFLEDCSLHYFKRNANEMRANWPMNEYGQTIIKGHYSGRLTIENISNKKYIQITYISRKKGKDDFFIKCLKLQNNVLKGDYVVKQRNLPNGFAISNILKNETDIKQFLLLTGNEDNPEETWEVRYKFIDKIDTIKVDKSFINSSPTTSTKMYLLKGNEVEVLETKAAWIKVRYYGNKTIDGWIKKSDVE